VGTECVNLIRECCDGDRIIAGIAVRGVSFVVATGRFDRHTA
jgi:hypothetical protein